MISSRSQMPVLLHHIRWRSAASQPSAGGAFYHFNWCLPLSMGTLATLLAKPLYEDYTKCVFEELNIYVHKYFVKNIFLCIVFVFFNLVFLIFYYFDKKCDSSMPREMSVVSSCQDLSAVLKKIKYSQLCEL